MKELFTPRLHLRYITEADTPRIFSCWASDPEVSRFVSWNTHQSISDTEAYVSFIMNEYKKSDCYRWGIELGDTGELIGIIDVVGYDEGMPVIGYCSGKAYWGRGFMTEALKAVTALLFEEGFEVLKIEAVKATPHDPCASVCATSTGVEAQLFVRLPKFDAGLQAKFTSLYATSRRIWVI
ncbi:MAG: GNAT family N-acetyltransferase [Ruminococcus sp.]|nr:GNAT family N-acetyltransferase [Ruminococcus sp.]